MPTILGIPYPPNWLSWPPGMSPEDGLLFKKWRDCKLAGAVHLYFNVRVGAGRPCGIEVDDNIRKDWLYITAKRIDLLIEYCDRWELVEFRSLANSNAIGRLLCYKMCYLEAPPDDRPVKLVLVTNLYDADVERLCHQFEIVYEVI